MMEIFANLDRLLAKTEITLDTVQKSQLVEFIALLVKWNKAYNLTSIRDPDEMLVKHIMDSLVVSQYLKGERFIDVGTGPGLPGIPLAIANPDKKFVLLDSLGKRIRFIQTVVHHLGLKNVEAVQMRVEDYLPEIGFDGVLSRAFASLSDMYHWCQHLPYQKGIFYALKGIVNEAEIKQVNDEAKVVNIYPLFVPELVGERHLIILQKYDKS